LAEHWLAHADLPPPLRHCAERLYGNAVARIAWLRLRQGAPGAALSRLFSHRGTPSLRPLAAATHAVAVHAFTRHVA
jgi:hypothetical protein